MARISLLLSLTLVIAIASVSGHPHSHHKQQKTQCPPTLVGLQNFPSIEISKLIEKETKSAPNTIQYNALLSICKGYNNYLGSIKSIGVKDVVGMIHTKFIATTEAIFAAKTSVGIEDKLEVKLKKNYLAMVGGFVELVEKIAEISKKYKFEADAKISESDKAKIEKCLAHLKSSTTEFLKVIAQCGKESSAHGRLRFPIGTGGKFISGLSTGLGAHTGANLGKSKISGFFEDFFGFGRKKQYDASGKIKFRGDNGFRSLKHPQVIHIN